jgi:hypothetical protein
MHARWLAGWLVAVLIAGCARPAPDPDAAAPPPAPVSPAEPTPAMASPDLSYVVLDDATSDSPFHWQPVESGPRRTRVIDGVLWAPVAPMVAVLRPGATAKFADGVLEIDGAVLDVPLRTIDGDAWADVAALAKALGGHAHRHPVDGSVALWPAPMLAWLAANGDPRAAVLIEVRAAGVLPPVPEGAKPSAAATTSLRLRNLGPGHAVGLQVQFPEAIVDFGDVPAGTTTDYRPVPGGVYGYAAYRVRLDGKAVSVPVIDWVGEKPLPGRAYTYVLAVDPRAELPVRLERVERDD